MIPPDKQNRPTNSIRDIPFFYNIKVSVSAITKLIAKTYKKALKPFMV